MPRKKKKKRKKANNPPLFDSSNFIRSTPIISRIEQKSPRLQTPSPPLFCLLARHKRQEKKMEASNPLHPPINSAVHGGGAHYRVWPCDEREINILTNIGETQFTNIPRHVEQLAPPCDCSFVGLTRYLVSGACSRHPLSSALSNCPICSNDRIIKSRAFSLFVLQWRFFPTDVFLSVLF